MSSQSRSIPKRIRASLAAVAVGCCVLGASNQTGQPEEDEGRVATVVLHDGQVMTGTLISESETSITLMINGIRSTIPNNKIRESYITPPVEDRYRAMRATIEDDDTERLIQIARWLIDKDRSDLALTELEGILKAEPFNKAAVSLKVVAEQNLKLEASRTAPGKQEDGQSASRPRRNTMAIPDFPLLTDEQINLIRVWEIDEKDPPRLRIKRETLEAVFEAYSDNPKVPETAAGREAILSASQAEQLRFLFSLPARDFYHEVEVLEDPEAIRIFRDFVNRTWLRNACATTGCHGGTEAGRLQLVRATTTSPEVYYTNMVILERYRTKDGDALLNFEDPPASLLLKYALPRKQTSTPHPDVRGWRSVFRTPQDRNYRRATEWIDAMWTPRPDYDIDYDPPTAMEPPVQADDGGR